MGIRSVFREAMPDLFEAAAEEATFTPAGGTPRPCRVFFDPGIMAQPDGLTTTVWEKGYTIEVCLSEIGDMLPSRGDRFTLIDDGRTFVAQQVLKDDEITVMLQVTPAR